MGDSLNTGSAHINGMRHSGSDECVAILDAGAQYGKVRDEFCFISDTGVNFHGASV